MVDNGLWYNLGDFLRHAYANRRDLVVSGLVIDAAADFLDTVVLENGNNDDFFLRK